MNEEQTTKARYHRPTFSIYGNLTELTRSGNPGAISDNGSNMMSATNPVNPI